MALPTSRNTTYAAGSQVKSADLNDIQDSIVQGAHGAVDYFIGAEMFAIPTGSGSQLIFNTPDRPYVDLNAGAIDEFYVPVSQVVPIGGEIIEVEVYANNAGTQTTGSSWLTADLRTDTTFLDSAVGSQTSGDFSVLLDDAPLPFTLVIDTTDRPYLAISAGVNLDFQIKVWAVRVQARNVLA